MGQNHAATVGRQLHEEPGPRLLIKVRAGFVSQGASLSGWCRRKGLHRENARDCLLGVWRGPKSDVLRAKLLRASGVSE